MTTSRAVPANTRPSTSSGRPEAVVLGRLEGRTRIIFGMPSLSTEQEKGPGTPGPSRSSLHQFSSSLVLYLPYCRPARPARPARLVVVTAPPHPRVSDPGAG